jgi:hypothetical protein
LSGSLFSIKEVKVLVDRKLYRYNFGFEIAMGTQAVIVETADVSLRRHPAVQHTSQDALLEGFLANDAKYYLTGVETTVECAVNIEQAKRDLTDANFEKFKERMRHDPSAISMYIKIAENKHIRTKDNWKYLPSGPSVLVIIARFTMDMMSADFNQLIKSKKLHSKITRSEARQLAGLKPKATRKPDMASTPSRAGTALIAAKEADYMDATEYSATVPKPSDTSTLIAPAQQSGTTDRLHIRQGLGPAVMTAPELSDAPTCEKAAGTQDLEYVVDSDNDVCIRPAVRDRYDARSLAILENKLYLLLSDCGMRDVRVILAVYN